MNMNGMESMVQLRFRRLLSLYKIDYSEHGEDDVEEKLLEILEQIHFKLKSQRFDINVLALSGAVMVGPIVGYLIRKVF